MNVALSFVGVFLMGWAVVQDALFSFANVPLLIISSLCLLIGIAWQGGR